jgi:anti-sigma factor RsiW
VIMNCKQIREEMDAASCHNMRSGAVRSHMDACPDCRRYSDETASLTRLLRAQPRVEAPPDFEFRLRARILRAQAAPPVAPRGFLWKIRPGTFSWGQTVAAGAALALVVTVSIFYVDRGAGTPEPERLVVADSSLNPRTNGVGAAPETKPPAIESADATPAKLTPRNLKARLASFRLESPASPNSVEVIDDSTPLYSPETKRLLKDRSVLYGAETASISLAKPAVLTF